MSIVTKAVEEYAEDWGLAIWDHDGFIKICDVRSPDEPLLAVYYGGEIWEAYSEEIMEVVPMYIESEEDCMALIDILLGE